MCSLDARVAAVAVLNQNAVLIEHLNDYSEAVINW